MTNSFEIFLIFVFFVVLLIFRKQIKKSLLNIFGGSIELPEMAGVVFLGLFIYMIIKEGNRNHEWAIYNELYIFFTAGAAMTGLGLQHVLDTVKEIRNVNSTTIETKFQKTETTDGSETSEQDS